MRAVADVQQGLVDDRPLYWARLKLQQRLRRQGLDRYVSMAERVSRGLDTQSDAASPSIVVTGFDPFNLDAQLDQSNPSGLIALALSERVIQGYRVLTAIFPVRYSDFDNWIVESYLRQFLASESIAMIVTTSMGRDGFDLERFLGKRRSSPKPDNAGVRGASNKPVLPPRLEGPEFLEFSLPIKGLANGAPDDTWDIRDNREVTTLEGGTFNCQTLQELEGKTAVDGSGGGFLSNEIAYRSQLLRHKLRVSTPVGHVHVPRVTGYDEETEQAIVVQFESILRKLIANLDSTK